MSATDGTSSGQRPRLTVPFADLGRGVAADREEIDAAIARVLDSGWYVLGAEGEAFEAELAAWLGAGHAVGVASGTDAIELALRALDIGPGAEVVTQANTCVPTVAAIERTGATAVLCDVEPAAGTMDPESARGALTARTRALIPVHLYGQCADMDPLLDLGVPVVEDCAQAHGATYHGRVAGTMGALGALSFYPTKNLGALGDGGAVVTGDPALAERLRSLRQYGQADRYHHVERGVNSRLDELQAAVLRVRLARLEVGNARRAAIAERYDAALAGADGFVPLARLEGHGHAHHLYVGRAPAREELQSALAERGVQTLVHYPQPVHGHAPYAALGDGPVSLAVAEGLAAEVLSLPLFPELTDDEVAHVAEAVGAAARVGA
jgi:dTDP-4-amino-4,6-dideoxygalactose transaminase